jgi:hypothetical protein
MTRPDFVKVQLSKKGVEIAGGVPVRIVAGHHEFEFKPGEPQDVTRAFDWPKVLEPQQSGGEAMFEIVDEAPRSRKSVEPRKEEAEKPVAE